MHGNLTYNFPQNASANAGSTSSSRNTQKSVHQCTREGRCNRKVLFERLNVLYDKKGYEYPIDEEGRICVPLDPEQTVSGSETEGNIENQTKN